MTVITTIIIILLGLSLGSLANCLIWRLSISQTILGRSLCPRCGHKIAWWDNIPIFSFLYLKGQCRFCRQSISWQYPVVELVMAALFLLAWLKVANYQFLSFPEMWSLLINQSAIWLLLKDWLAIFLLIIIFTFDWRFFLIPINLLIIFTPLFWLFNLFIGVSWWWPLLSAALMALFFASQFFLTKGRGLGEGDIYLGISLGFLFPNMPQLIVTVLIAYLLGSLVGLSLMLLGQKKWQSRLPLGTFLAIGAILSLFWGEVIYLAYLSIFKI